MYTFFSTLFHFICNQRWGIGEQMYKPRVQKEEFYGIIKSKRLAATIQEAQFSAPWSEIFLYTGGPTHTIES
jgi:hypothetical protein